MNFLSNMCSLNVHQKNGIDIKIESLLIQKVILLWHHIVKNQAYSKLPFKQIMVPRGLHNWVARQ
jgi:hypothetical protein